MRRSDSGPAVAPSGRRRKPVSSRLAVAGRVAVVVLVIGVALFGVTSPAGLSGLGSLPYLAMGAVLIVRRPRTSIGWILAALGACFAVVAVPVTITAAEMAEGANLPLIVFAIIHAGLGTTAFFLFALLAMVFPSGRLPTGRWGRWGRVGLAGGLLMTAVAYVLPELIVGYPASVPVRNPAGLFPELAIWSVLTPASVIFPVVVLVTAAAISLAVRVRRADGIEREQLRWLAGSLALVMSAAVGGFVITALVPGSETFAWIPAILAIPTVPVAVAVAVLRYRLYDIDRIISRTISYGTVTVALVAVYAVFILLLQAPLSAVTGGETVAIAASTLAAAGLFHPLRRRVQRAVDRRFNRARYDAEQTSALFATELRDGLDPSRTSASLLGAVDATMGPRRAQIWIRNDPRGAESSRTAWSTRQRSPGRAVATEAGWV